MAEGLLSDLRVLDCASFIGRRKLTMPTALTAAREAIADHDA
ncbi:hypothetical protein [Phenylobacterium montanum]|nr:hypothetical protein [Caulobacter sp. S6]